MSATSDHCWVHVYVKGKRSEGVHRVVKPEKYQGNWDVAAVLHCVYELAPDDHGNVFKYLAFAPGTKEPQHAAKADALDKDMSVVEIKTKTEHGEEPREITYGNPLLVVVPGASIAAKPPEQGEYSTVQHLWEPKGQTFRGGYESIRRTKILSHYRYLLEEIGALHPGQRTDDESLKSNALSNRTGHSVSGKKKDLFGWGNAEDAHQTPDSKTCAPSYGIIGQPIMGLAKEKDIEGLSLQELKTIRKDGTQTAAGQEEHDRKEHVKGLLTCIGSTAKYSLKNLALNKIRVGPGHQNPYDVAPEYMILPLMSLEVAKAWNPGEGYWVAVICKSPTAYQEYLGERPDAARNGYHVDYAGEKELKDATGLLAAMVKAHAEVANGTRGDDAAIVTPLDFITGNDKTEMEKLQDEIQDGKVSVPTAPHNFKGKIVLKVYVSSSHDYKIPDPLLVAMKAAINWFFMTTGKKLLPASGKPMGPKKALIEQLNDELYEKLIEEERPPVPLTIGVSRPARVSLSPASSFDEGSVLSPAYSSDEGSDEA
jgi:hypothetical protein